MEYSQEWDLSSIPDTAFYAELQRRRASKPRPGRRNPGLCRWCNQPQPSVRDRRKHQTVCPKNPRVARILAAQQSPREPPTPP